MQAGGGDSELLDSAMVDEFSAISDRHDSLTEEVGLGTPAADGSRPEIRPTPVADPAGDRMTSPAGGGKKKSNTLL